MAVDWSLPISAASTRIAVTFKPQARAGLAMSNRLSAAYAVSADQACIVQSEQQPNQQGRIARRPGKMMPVGDGVALKADVAAADRIVGIAADAHHPPATGLNDQTAIGFADMAGAGMTWHLWP